MAVALSRLFFPLPAVRIPAFQPVVERMKEYIAQNPTQELVQCLPGMPLCSTFAVNHSDVKFQVRTAGHLDPNNVRWYPSVITFGGHDYYGGEYLMPQYGIAVPSQPGWTVVHFTSNNVNHLGYHATAPMEFR